VIQGHRYQNTSSRHRTQSCASSYHNERSFCRGSQYPRLLCEGLHRKIWTADSSWCRVEIEEIPIVDGVLRLPYSSCVWRTFVVAQEPEWNIANFYNRKLRLPDKPGVSQIQSGYIGHLSDQFDGSRSLKLIIVINGRRFAGQYGQK
jgi:hypothetical protein